jgi:uncharacterized protein YndB with AHSA1/START domain
MLKESSFTENSLDIAYVMNSSLDKIYSSWTDKKMLFPWMGGANVKVNQVKVNLEVDGGFEFEMESPDGIFIAFGEYRIIEPEKLVFSWSWKESMEEETLVTVELEATEEGALIKLSHEQLPSEQAVGHHMEGWLSSLEKLEKFIT